MSTDVFGILDDTSSDPDLKLEPFFKIIKKNDKELHEWLNVVVEALVEQSQMRT